LVRHDRHFGTPAFLVSVFFLVISPGPDLLLISSYSTARGFKSGLAISLAIFGAGLPQTGLVAFGLGENHANDAESSTCR